MPLTAAPLTVLTLTAVRSAWKRAVEAVRAVQSSSIGENELPKTAPVPPPSVTPAGVTTDPAWTGLTLDPLEVCLTIGRSTPRTL